MQIETMLKNVKHVYHATSRENLSKIREHGLKTNTAIDKKNYGYLSKSNSIYFSTNPKHAKKFIAWCNQECVILEIPIEEIENKCLVVDENFTGEYPCPENDMFNFDETCFRLIDETNKIIITNFKVMTHGELNHG